MQFIDPKKRPIINARKREIKLTFNVTQRGGRSLGKTSAI
jgi:hypothetical protein